MSKKTRVCVVGAGPSGMSALYQFGQMDSPPEVVCYEKQSTWGGLWNYEWRVGTDENGETVHGGMYKHLWSNGPKECLEFPDYTFEQHFGKAIPSFPPRAVLKDYLEGRWTKTSKVDIKEKILFSHVVRYVRYDKARDEFEVTVCDAKNSKNKTERFTHVIVAVGIFNVPNVPSFPGIETFAGRVIHAHDFRDAIEFKGQRVLVVGASYSAEDVALQCKKFGAKSVTCTWRTKPMGFKWPEGIEERSLVQRLDKKTAYFKDGTNSDFDAIILSTGYRYHFPFMENELRLVCGLSLYPDSLYKGVLWTKGGNNKLFYLGVQDQYYTFTMFEVQALWAFKYIVGKIPKQEKSAMAADVAKWVKRREGLKDCHDEIDFQSDFVFDLCKTTGYNEKIVKSSEIMHTWEHQRDDDIMTYRDKGHVSIFTGTPSPRLKTTWMDAKDDSIETFVKN